MYYSGKLPFLFNKPGSPPPSGNFSITFGANNAVVPVGISDAPIWFSNADFTIEWADGVVAEFTWTGSGWAIGGYYHYPLASSGAGATLEQGANSAPVEWSAGTVWTPLLLPSLLAWSDASDAATITHTAGAVSQWDDKSGNNNHFTQATGARQPLTGVNTVNGLNVITLDGSGDAFDCAAALFALGNNNCSIFLAVETTNASKAAQRWVNGVISSNSTRFSIAFTSSGTIFNTQSGTSTINNAFTVDTNPHMIGFVRNGLTQYPFIDNIPQTNGAAANQSLTDMEIGRQASSGADPAEGHLLEIVVCSAVSTDDDQNALHRYTFNKWGIPYTPLS